MKLLRRLADVCGFIPRDSTILTKTLLSKFPLCVCFTRNTTSFFRCDWRTYFPESRRLYSWPTSQVYLQLKDGLCGRDSGNDLGVQVRRNVRRKEKTGRTEIREKRRRNGARKRPRALKLPDDEEQAMRILARSYLVRQIEDNLSPFRANRAFTKERRESPAGKLDPNMRPKFDFAFFQCRLRKIPSDSIPNLLRQHLCPLLIRASLQTERSSFSSSSREETERDIRKFVFLFRPIRLYSRVEICAGFLRKTLFVGKTETSRIT